MTYGSLLKAKADCGCAVPECTEYGTRRPQPWADGTWCVTTCTLCRHCRGRGASKAGNRSAAKARSHLGPEAAHANTVQEERWRHAVRDEHKSGETAGKITRQLDHLLLQPNASRAKAIGDTRHAVLTLDPLHTGPRRWLAIPLEDFVDACLDVAAACGWEPSPDA